MNLTEEQKKYLQENSIGSIHAVASTAKIMASRFTGKLDFSPEDIQYALYIFSMGEKHPDMYVDGVSIYSKDYGPWDDKAKQLNFKRGACSVELATNAGISLNEEEINAIESMSAGKNINPMALIMKVAQTYEAVKRPRWSRGERKEAAKNFDEVSEILQEEIGFMLRGKDIDTIQGLSENLIEAARATYNIEKISDHIHFLSNQQEHRMSPTQLTDERLSNLYGKLSNDEIGALYGEVLTATSETNVGEIVSRYEDEAKGKISAEDIKKAVSGISAKDALDILDDVNIDNKKPEVDI